MSFPMFWHPTLIIAPSETIAGTSMFCSCHRNSVLVLQLVLHSSVILTLIEDIKNLLSKMLKAVTMFIRSPGKEMFGLDRLSLLWNGSVANTMQINFSEHILENIIALTSPLCRVN